MLAPCIAEAFDFRLTVEDTTYSKIFFAKVRLVLKPITEDIGYYDYLGTIHKV